MNPKKKYGDQKPRLSFMPTSILLQVARVFELGAGKYGLKNWRRQAVDASTYHDAIFRHLTAWFEGGEDIDDESGQSHLAHIIACAMILMDAKNLGMLVDDRGKTEVLDQLPRSYDGHMPEPNPAGQLSLEDFLRGCA